MFASPSLVRAGQPAQAKPLLSANDLDGVDPTIRQQILEAHDRAMRDQSAAALGELGMRLHAYDRFEQAAACYAEARRRAPRAFEWTYYEGVALAMAGDVERAVRALQDAVSLSPTDFSARLRLAELLLEQARIDEGVHIYKRLVADRPSSALAHYGLARALSEQGAPAALEHYARAAALAPDFSAPHYALAMAYSRAGNLERAREAQAKYEATRRQPPPSDDLWLERVSAYRSGPFEDLARGRQWLRSGRHKDAVEAFERAVRASPGLLQAHVNLVAAYAAVGAADKAESAYAAAAAISPELPELHYNLGVLRLSQQRADEAIVAFERALAGNPAYADAHNNLGFLLAERGKAREAAGHFRAALSANPEHRDAHFNLARVLLASKDDASIVHFTRAAAVEDEKTSLYLYYLADAHARLGRHGEAKRVALEARKRAVAHGQTRLVETIDDDLRRLQALQERRK